MSWIKRSEYENYVAGLDPELKAMGAAERHYENHEWAGDYVFVGMVRFPSGLRLEAWPGRTTAVIHLWGEMDLPFRGFEAACQTANQAAEACGYLAQWDKAKQSIEVWGYDSWDHHMVKFRDDRMVDVVRIREG